MEKSSIFVVIFPENNCEMKPLLGRENEKKIFDELLNSDKAEFVAVYGRRRIGKTFLVRQYLQKQIVFDFTGSNNDETSAQLANFSRVFSEQCQELHQTPENWADAFFLLAKHLKTIKRKSKIVIFFDELPWLDRPKSGFLSALEFFWNQYGSQINNLMLVVCGSAASWMIKNIVNAKDGLYKRMTRSIALEPFTLRETELFLKYKKLHFTQYQIIKLYMALGGIPFYLEAIKPEMSVEQVIQDLFFEKNGFLQKEFKPLYQSLFKKAQHHLQIATTLSSHPHGITREQISAATKIPEGGSLSRALDNLIDSGFVTIILPFGKKKKDALYRIVDFFSIFYLKFVQSSTSKKWQSISQTPAYHSWCGYAFENVCLLHIDSIKKKLGIEGVDTQIYSWKKTGTTTERGTQIDLIMDRKDGIVNLCEAKFTDSEFVLTKDYNTHLRQRKAIFKEVTKSKKNIVTTLLTTYPARKNEYYLEQIQSEVNMEHLFL